MFDEQATRLPKGPVGVLEPPEARLVEGLPAEAVGLLREYLGGGCSTMDFASRIKAIHVRSLQDSAGVLDR